jgi:DNA mismatch endonuclease, patch repair protein
VTDRIDPLRRSANMARIRSRDTKPEIVVRRAAHAVGLRFRLHHKELPGKPDLVFPSARIAVFVHGCFWHRHSECRNCSEPKTRVEFWRAKFAANVQRDRQACHDLQQLGWLPIIIWECETEDIDKLTARVSELRQLRHTRSRFQLSSI